MGVGVSWVRAQQADRRLNAGTTLEGPGRLPGPASVVAFGIWFGFLVRKPTIQPKKELHWKVQAPYEKALVEGPRSAVGGLAKQTTGASPT